MTADQLAEETSQTTRSPNVVVIMCDDLGYGDLGCYGSSMISTPEIDSIAEQGVRFASMYSGGPTCTPARAAFLTGRHAPRTGAGRVSFPGEDIGLHEAEVTIADYLSSGGYDTMCIGKWHVGEMPHNGPTQHGFRDYFGLPFSNDMPRPELYRGSNVVETDVNVAELTERYAAEAVSFINAANEDTPFLLFVAPAMPHHEVVAGARFAGQSQAGPYGDAVEEIDYYCGEIRRALETKGLWENTIFVFTSDHGPWFEGSTGGLRGRKFETWEGGVRVPFIVSWPANWSSVTIDVPCATVDLLPTVLSAAGIAPHVGQPIDGVDLAPVVRGEQSEHPPIFYFDVHQVNAVRDGKWKLHRARQSWGERFASLSLPQLFDLERDPAECYDLSAHHPDVVEQLSTTISQLQNELPSAPPFVEWWRAMPGTDQHVDH